MSGYICRSCGKEYPLHTLEYKCSCGGLFGLEAVRKSFDFDQKLPPSEVSLWRYSDVLPFSKAEGMTLTLGEGMTPLISIEKGLFGKADYYMPTLSFKDRGAVMLVLLAKKLGFHRLAVDSSGNAATAVAAYSARAGIQCTVFVPEGTSQRKLTQIKAHGAKINIIDGPREASGTAAREFVAMSGAFYASHIYNPFFYEGTKTYFYEVFEQMGMRFPDGFIIPVGNGTLVLGAALAFSELQRQGLIGKWPKIAGVQAAGCNPVYKAFKEGKNKVEPVVNKGTIAEGIAIAAPARGNEVLDIIKQSGGEILSIDDDDTQSARKLLARKGIYVEITSGINYAASLKLGRSNPHKTWVIPLCGAGIKSS